MSLLALIAAHAGGGAIDPPPVGWSLGEPGDPVWVPAGALDTWRASRDNSANELVEVAFFGDSTSYGEADGLDAHYPTAYMARQLSTADGYADGGVGHYVRWRSDPPHLAHPMTYGPTVETYLSEDSLGFLGKPTLTPRLISTEGAYVTWRGEGRYARLVFSRDNLLRGPFTWSFDDGTGPNGTVPTATENHPDGYESIWVDIGTPGPHEVTITALGGEPTAPPVISNVAASAVAGALPAGTYYYVTTFAPTSGGETTPSAQASVTITAGQSPRVNMPRAVGYAGQLKVYRSTTSGGPYAYVGGMETNGNGAYGWTDDGSLTPGDPPPTVSTAGKTGVKYVSLEVEWFNDDVGIVWHRDSESGTRALTALTPHAQFRLGLSGGTEGAHPKHRRVRLAINAYGINNQQQVADQTEILRADLSAWVDLARAAGADPLLVIPLYESAGNKDTVDAGTTDPRWLRFRQVHRDVAIDKQCALIDLGSGGALAGQGPWGTNPHLSQAEYQDQADYLWHELLKL